MFLHERCDTRGSGLEPPARNRIVQMGSSRLRRVPSRLRARRMIAAAVLYLAQLVGAALLVANQIVGLYVAAVAMVVALTFMISSAWLLVVGVTMRESKFPDRSP
jgi:hypothetical protein